MEQQPLAYLMRDFLESEEGRPIRIISEYLEPLRRFREQNIQDTVVFFGSARVHSRDWARRALADVIKTNPHGTAAEMSELRTSLTERYACPFNMSFRILADDRTRG